MNVLVKLSNGNTTSIPNVHWHPEWEAHITPSIPTRMPAGCYVRMSAVKKANDTYNAFCKKQHLRDEDRSLENFVDLMDCAEMPFDILDDESEFPWKNFGNCVKEVRYGMSDDFWRNRA